MANASPMREPPTPNAIGIHAPLRIYVIVVLGGAIRVIARTRAGGLFRCLVDLLGNLVGDRFVQLVVDEIDQGTARR